MCRRVRTFGAAGLILCVVCAALLAAGQAQQPPTDQPPVFRAGANVVRVDVIATNADGQPLADLTAEDFELVEDGVRQPIQAFRFIEINPGWLTGPEGAPRPIRTTQDEITEAARDEVRLIGIFLDDYHVRRESSLWVRDQLAVFVDNEIGPSDMVGLMYPLHPIGAVRFTRNPRGVSSDLRQFVGRRGDRDPINDIERNYAYMLSPAEIDEIRHDVSLSALKALIVRMGGLKEGRKTLILVSEGYTPHGGSSAALDLEVDIRLVYDLANRNNVSIIAIDPRGLIGPMFGGSAETLRTLAMTTDGAAVINRNDVTAAMRQVIREASAYYLLGYATPAPADGKFHSIRLRVRRPGVRLRYRQGYWAPTREEAERLIAARAARPVPPREVESALATMTALGRARSVRTWIGFDRTDNGPTLVTFAWEPTNNVGATRPASVSLTGVGRGNEPLYRGRVAVAVSGTTGGGFATFTAPPGAAQLRVAIEDAAGQVLESDVREITVPDMTGSGVLMATPVVFRARTPREAQAIRDGQAAPGAGREFRRSERLIVQIKPFSRTGSGPSVSARLLNRLGQSLMDVPVAGAGETVWIDLALASFEPGEYVLEVAALSGDAAASEFIGLRLID